MRYCRFGRRWGSLGSLRAQCGRGGRLGKGGLEWDGMSLMGKPVYRREIRWLEILSY
jgi:hypothetical protein